MGVIITPQKEIDKYFDSDRVSQSVLKSLIGGFDSFLVSQERKEEMIDKENQSFVIGSAVDCILTGEEGEFSNQYYVSQIENKPSDVEMSIVKRVLESATEGADNISLVTGLVDYPGFIVDAINEIGWQSRWKIDTRVNKIVEVGTEYFEDLKKSFGKTIISESQRFLIDEIITSLKTNPRTSHYFDRDMLSRASDVDIYYQLPIYFNHKGLECKALLDILLVFKNPENGVIESVQPVDLKTMHGFTLNFLNSLKQWRYDIQGAWYTLAVRKWLDSSDVVIKPFMFVVESTNNIGTPLVYKLTDELLNIGQSGRLPVFAHDLNDSITDNVVISREIKGFEQLVDEYIYYSENEWREDKKITQSNGVLEINWNGITK